MLDPGAHRLPPLVGLCVLLWLGWATGGLAAPSGQSPPQLPLLSHWNTGKVRSEGWSPSAQIALIDRGHHLLPWIELPDDLADEIERDPERFREYYEPALRRARELHLPISLVGSQWERFLSDPPYIGLPAAENPNLVDNWGLVSPVLTPFGPIAAWRAIGRQITSSKNMAALQRMYPDPPLVIFLSNNEHPRLSRKNATRSAEYVRRFGFDLSPEAQRDAFSDGWAERYRALQAGMRDGLASDAWRRAARFVGFDAFGPMEMGRSDRWKQDATYLPDPRNSPSRTWDGASVPFYTDNWNDKTDFTTRSPQIEAMNLVFQKAAVEAMAPEFWFELSIWDGFSPGERNDKRQYYKSVGQEYTPARYAAMAQFGMWLLRPRAVREYRGYDQAWSDCRDYFMALVAMVDRVHTNSALRKWWQSGRLVSNPRHQHPYELGGASEYTQAPRWYLLDTSIGPRDFGGGPGKRADPVDVPVFALALERGQAPKRQWLVYAFAPRGARRGVRVFIPRFGNVPIDAPVGGAFHEVDESTKLVRRLD